MSLARVTGFVSMKKSKQHVPIVKDLQRAVIQGNAVNVESAYQVISGKDVLMEKKNQAVGTVGVVNFVNILDLDACAKFAMEQGFVNTIGKETNVLNAEPSQFANIKG